MSSPVIARGVLHPEERPIRIIIVVKRRIASWVEGRHEAWGALIVLSLFAALVEIGFAGASARGHFFGVASYALSIALAALIIGIFLGFLFGIPRTLTGNSPAPRPAKSVSKSAGKPISAGDNVTVTVSDGGETGGNGLSNFGVNTNLEQISDWLTKIMVGVGLTQIGKLPGAVRVLADGLRPGFGEIQGAGTLGVLIVLFFSVCGFLIGYLWTRIYLTKEFVNAEVEATAKRLEAKVSTMESANEKVAAALSTVEAQPDKDATALNLVLKQMDPTTGDNPVEQERLDKALREGSPSLKVQVFYMARKLRKDAKRTDMEQIAATRVIPIFLALSKCDDLDRYHRTHAQLAYSLLDQVWPDPAAAFAEIERAIKIRDDHNTAGYLNYEVFRALCRMPLMERASPTEREVLRVAILSDLRKAAQADMDYVREVSRAVDWMRQERVSEEELVAG